MAISSRKSNGYSLLPDWYDLVSYYAAAFVTLVGLNAADVLKAVDHRNFESLSQRIGSYISSAVHRVDVSIPKSGLTFLIWALVGCLAYVVVWPLVLLYKSYKDNSKLLSGYVFPVGAKRSQVLHAVMLRFGIRFLALSAFLGWLALFLYGILPLTATMIIESVQPVRLKILFTAVEVLTIVAASFFVQATLLKLFLLHKRLFKG